MRKYRDYTDSDIIENSKHVKSIAALCRSLGIKGYGGNIDNMKRNLQRLNVDTEHWTGKAWNKEQQLKDWSQYTRGVTLKPHLIKERGHKCEKCNLETWLHEPITLELEHIDGDKTNNQLENLSLLCPNCHSLTRTWKNRKR